MSKMYLTGWRIIQVILKEMAEEMDNTWKRESKESQEEGRTPLKLLRIHHVACKQ